MHGIHAAAAVVGREDVGADGRATEETAEECVQVRKEFTRLELYVVALPLGMGD